MQRKILVVDDEKDIVALLRYNLEKEGYAVSTASTGREALAASLAQPDLILLDVMMPEMDGFEVTRRLKQEPRTARVPILFLTARGGELDEVVGLELGAEDYLVKPIRIPKLLARIRAILRRSEAAVEGAPHRITRFGDVEIDSDAHTIRISGQETFFTKREFDLLAFLASRAGTVQTREALLDAVWGDDIHVIDRTVDVHIRRIREKLGEQADLVETVKGVGYRIREKR